MMKHAVLAVVLALAACGSKTPPVENTGGGDTGPVKDTRTEIEKRRDTACEALGPRITACAIADAKVRLDAGELKQKDYDAITKSEVTAKNTAEFIENCGKAEYSSRQIRVLEVCPTEESECDPMLACLDNLNAK